MKLTSLAFALAVLGAALPADASTYFGYANSPGVIWLSDPAPAPLTNATVSQAQNAFVPKLLVVPIGTSVHFAVGDGSCSVVFGDLPFTVNLPTTKRITFSYAGPVPIRCQTKPSMRGTVVVVDGPYAVVKQIGGYDIVGVIPGPHMLHAWSRGTKVSTLSVIVR
jgi:plastocyanin